MGHFTFNLKASANAGPKKTETETGEIRGNVLPIENRLLCRQSSLQTINSKYSLAVKVLETTKTKTVANLERIDTQEDTGRVEEREETEEVPEVEETEEGEKCPRRPT